MTEPKPTYFQWLDDVPTIHCYHLNTPDCPRDWDYHETTCPDCQVTLYAEHDDCWNEELGESDECHYWMTDPDGSWKELP